MEDSNLTVVEFLYSGWDLGWISGGMISYVEREVDDFAEGGLIRWGAVSKVYLERVQEVQLFVLAVGWGKFFDMRSLGV